MKPEKIGKKDNPFLQGSNIRRLRQWHTREKEPENMENLLGGSKKKFVKYEEGAAMFSMGLHSFRDL